MAVQTVRHGLKLMQSNPDVQSVESVQVFDILILGEYDGHQLLTLRVRPLPGATVDKLDAGNNKPSYWDTTESETRRWKF